MGSMGVQVFLVDDHEVVRQGVRRMLEGRDDIEIVGEADNVADAYAGIVATEPDVALVDVRLPDGSGIELIRDVRSRRDELRCVIFTSFADDEAFFQSVVAGASGYLMKDVGEAELVAGLKAVAGGASLIRPEVIDDLRRRATALPREDRLLESLTGQEQRILRMVTEGMTNREIAFELGLAEKTVRNYVSTILGKVGLKNRTQLAAYVARRSGLNRR